MEVMTMEEIGSGEESSTIGDDWVRDLEAVLDEEQDLPSKSALSTRLARATSANRADNPRVHNWMTLLGVMNKPDAMTDWDHLFDLPEQKSIRSACKALAERVASSDSGVGEMVSIVSQLESVITLFSKRFGLPFTPDNGWMEILRPLIVNEVERSALYHLFFAITTKYIPRGCSTPLDGSRAFDLFRLLLLYHEPSLCSFLDTRKVSPGDFARSWFASLFAGATSLPVCIRLWDVYFHQADPFLVFFMALVMLVNAKDEIQAMKESSREEIAAFIAQFPSALSADDMGDFCDLAAYYSSRTPQSFRRDFHGALFGANLADDSFNDVSVHYLLCLPVSIPELVRSSNDDHATEGGVRYFVIDGRPMREYVNGHFTGAFNLDCSLMVNSPAEFHLAVQSLGAFKANAHPDEHICFIGSGDALADQYIHMVVASFLQHGHAHVSLAHAGYQALHALVVDGSPRLANRIDSHVREKCAQCRRTTTLHSPTTTRDSPSLVSRVRAAVSDRGLALKAMKEKMTEYVSPRNETTTRHVDSADRHGKRYRNAPSLFSLDGESGGSEDEEMVMPGVGQARRDKADILDHFDGNEVIAEECIPCHIALSRTHLHVLHDCPHESGCVITMGRHPLASVQKMTSKKRLPELLTIRYGYELASGEHKTTAVQRFLIPKAGDAAKAIKTAIYALHGAATSTGESAMRT